MDKFRRLRSPFKTKTRCESVQSEIEHSSVESRNSPKFDRTASMEEPNYRRDNNSLLTASSSPSLSGSPFRKLSPLRSPKKDSDFSEFAHFASSADGVKLTSHQGDLVREAWHQANKRKGNAGVFIFKWLFTNYPHLKETFDLDNVAADTVEEHPRFRHHAKVFTDVLEMIVDSLDALDDSMGPLLVSYGSKHVQFEHKNGFKPEYWNYFASAMCEYANQSWKLNLHSDTMHSWRILVYFVVSKVKEGFYFEKNRQEALTNKKIAGSV